MNKLLGYIVVLLGIIVIALSFSGVQEALSLSFPVSDMIILAIGAVIALIGALVIGKSSSSSGSQPTELPIYEGKNVVAFRRTGK